MKANPSTSRNASDEVDAYLAKVPEAERRALERVRSVIKETAKGVTERVAYKMPVFRLHRDLVALAKHKQHLSFYTMSPAVVEKCSDALRGVTVSGATIHFTAEAPLSREVLERVIRERVKEDDERKNDMKK